MKKQILVIFSFLALAIQGAGQEKKQKVFTSDITNFWIAYDSIRNTKDSLRQIQFIRALYIDKGTEGLKAFMEARDYSAELWVNLINAFPRFWNSVRPNTLAVKSKATEIENSIEKLRKLYPDLKEANMYFTVGGLRSGGTTMNDMVLIGTEIATGTAETDVSEFPNKWLEGVFRDQRPDNIVPLNIHEYIHTQQRGRSKVVLDQAIREGACDFVTELVIGKPMENNYIQYGRAHEQELKEKFRQEMFTTAYEDWLYNGSSAKTVADLGYFMGYAICKSYYQHAKDKKMAIKEIIELNYSDDAAIENFLRKSKYYPEELNREELVRNYEKKLPFVVALDPIANGDTMIDPGLKEIRIVFSQPMSEKGYSFDFGEKGKDAYPITGVKGFSSDRKVFSLKVDLQPNRDYEFVVTGKSFKSADGYAAKPLKVKFRTR